MSNIQSPCIKQCVLNDENVCLSCLRTLEEIKYWSKMTDAERQNVLFRIKTSQFDDSTR